MIARRFLAITAVITLAACGGGDDVAETTETEVVTQPGTDTVGLEVPVTDTMVIEQTTTVDVDTTVRQGTARDTAR